MILNLADIEEAGKRLASGEQPYEFRTSDSTLRIPGPACGFGAEYLQRCRTNGMYAESLEEAQAIAHARNLIITGVWFVKRPS
ncbi:MAG TPA: hypothetical protein VFD58_08755 [Blastocatellia bacterium]|nr:hypothetical protein [Blastocatellia bacterium]